MADPQPYDFGEEGYLAFVIAEARRSGAPMPLPPAPRGDDQGDAGNA
ncbi:hypothetical protein PQS31_06145 [Luteimonas sp BLCC-B24]|nr:hypothetical protein [Luteimonas sp. BLCC-B24]MDC7806404.1 hypothetical protein [Luteimonas sp. BLCC-B24]